MALQCPLITLLPMDTFFFGCGFSPGHHRWQYPVSLLRLRHDSTSLDSIVKGNSPYGEIAMPAGHSLFTTNSPFDVAGDIKLSAAHTLHAPCNDDLCITRLDLHGSIADHIQSSAATTVQSNPGNRVGPTCLKEKQEGNIDILTALIGFNQNHLIHLSWIHPSPFDSFV